MKLVVTDWSDPAALAEVPENVAALYDEAFVFPVQAREEILEVLQKRAALKKEFGDSMKLVYELCNKLTRENRRR